MSTRIPAHSHTGGCNCAYKGPQTQTSAPKPNPQVGARPSNAYYNPMMRAAPQNVQQMQHLTGSIRKRPA